ncbi:MAG: HEAT repeat domain-containing protein, partial [Cyanobacteriota bacterium]|nr:HEAT repeat domain-containing protein [Cyanobacteriota bacterium]
GIIGTKAATSTLVQALAHQNADIRCNAVSALGQRGNSTAIATLLKLLKDRDAMVRARTIEALERIGPEATLAGLVDAINDGDAYVRLRAKFALERIINELTETPESSCSLVTLDSLLKPSSFNAKLPKLLVASFAEARKYLYCQTPQAPIRHLISIGSPGVELLPGRDRVPHRLRLEFSDLEAPENDPDCLMATAGDIERAIQFAASVSPEDGTLLIHCQAGISRSCAIAIAVCAQILGAGREEEAANCVLKVRPGARPNRWVVELADAALHREGRLTRAVERLRERDR